MLSQIPYPAFILAGYPAKSVSGAFLKNFLETFLDVIRKQFWGKEAGVGF
jgi:hypothetical protein